MKRITDGVRYDLLHVALPFVKFSYGITHITRLKYSSYNITERAATNYMGFFLISANKTVQITQFRIRSRVPPIDASTNLLNDDLWTQQGSISLSAIR